MNFKLKTLGVSVVFFGAVLSSMSASAMTVTYDFDSYAHMTDIAGVNLGIATITRGGDSVFAVDIDPATSCESLCSTNTIGGSPFSGVHPFKAVFSISGVNNVMVDLGDLGADSETLFLEAFDSDNVSLDRVEQTNPEEVASMTTLSVWATDISYVIFGGIGNEYFHPTKNEWVGPFDNSLFADNLKISNVPIPAALPLFGTGLALLGFVGWRRKCKAKA